MSPQLYISLLSNDRGSLAEFLQWSHSSEMESRSELDLLVTTIHQYAHHSLERFLSRLNTLGPNVHLDI